MSTRLVAIAVTAAVVLGIAVGGTATYFVWQRNQEITTRQDDVATAFHTFICFAAQQQHPVHPPIFYKRILLKMHAGPCARAPKGAT